MKHPSARSALFLACFALAISVVHVGAPSPALAQQQEQEAGAEEAPSPEPQQLEEAGTAPAPDGGVGAWWVAGVVVLMLLVFGWRSLTERSRTGALARVRRLSEVRPLAALHVTTVSIGLDWRARPRVQGVVVRALGKPAGPLSDDHLAHLATTLQELRDVEPLWLAVGAKTEGPIDAAQLGHDFRARVRRLHALYDAGSGSSPRAGDERLGVAVLSVMVVRTEAPSGEASDVESTKALLESLTAEPESIVAWDLGWGPRGAGERLSMQQLAERFPELAKVGEPSPELPEASAALIARWS